MQRYYRVGNVTDPLIKNSYQPSGSLMDLSPYIIEDGDIEVNEVVEFDDVFKYSVGNVTFRMIKGDTAIEEVFDAWNLSNNNQEWSIEILVDSVPYFYGVLDKEATSFDETTEIRTVVAKDWLKVVYESWKETVIPELDVPQLNTFLPEVFKGITLDTIIKIGGLPEYFQLQEYNTALSDGLSRSQLLFECQKAYGAYVFLTPDKKIAFINRSQYLNETSKNLDDYILDGNFNRIYYQKEKYDAALINVAWPTEYGNYEGWALVQGNGDGTISTLTGINADLSNIPPFINYLDLRQLLTKSGDAWVASFDLKILYAPTPPEIYEIYKTILDPVSEIECSVDRIDINIFDKVSVNSEIYQVFEARKYLVEGVSELLLRKPVL